MYKSILTTLLVVITPQLLQSQEVSNYKYSVPDKPWPESFGNHRAVITVSQTGKWVDLDLYWRRHDLHPDNKRFIIIEAETGDTIPNIWRLSVTNERCQISFGPVVHPGKYYFYYLPYVVQEGWGFYNYGYLKPEGGGIGQQFEQSGNDKLSGEINSRTRADVIAIEARTLFDSFYPMEVIALQAEKDSLLEMYHAPFLVFPEDRKYPIRMKDDIPLRWAHKGPSKTFHGSACTNEYYVFQLGVYAARTRLNMLNVQFSKLICTNKAGKHRPSDIKTTCFNTNGTDPYGMPFTKQLSVEKGAVQSLWIGVDIPSDIDVSSLSGELMIKADGIEDQKVKYTIDVSDKVLSDRGDSETWRHSRLRWLNSTAGLDDEPVKPYDAIRRVSTNALQTGMAETDYANSGLPSAITAKTNILAAPISFALDTGDGKLSFQYPAGEILKENAGLVEWKHQWTSTAVDVVVQHSLEFDGYQHYYLSIKAKQPLELEDARLEIPFEPKTATYMMGMGLPGCETPDDHVGKWGKPEDSFWLGNAEGGLWCEIRGSSYHGPLLNLYKPDPPEPWFNNGRGYLSIKKSPAQTMATVGTGKIQMYPGEKWVFEFALLPTPVKPLNTAEHFTNRYYHSGGAPAGVEAELENGIKIVNIHHANKYNPYINYPFIAVKELRDIIDRYHALDLKVKIYYTIRELTNHVTEIWALRSLDNEILGSGNGRGYPWLREHFVSDYTPQWYQHFEDGSVDASVLTSTQASRWYNYYIEGLAWLVRNQDIDGIYLDDVAFDRRILKRMRKVMEAEKPGCLIDLHSNTGFSKGPAMQYAEYFPYVDKLWFGESFQYNQMSAPNWFVEVSGIPFGLMGDMLHGGGNRWLGMLFGMTVRLPWTSEGFTANPRPVWNFWDEFQIDKAQMIGFWEDDCPVRAINSDNKADATNHDLPDVRVTVYRKSDSTLVVIGNFSDRKAVVKLAIDWDALGLNPGSTKMYAPAVENFQPAKVFSLDEPVIVPAKEGWMILLK